MKNLYATLCKAGLVSFTEGEVNWDETLAAVRAAVEPEAREAREWDQGCEDAVKSVLQKGQTASTPAVISAATIHILGKSSDLAEFEEIRKKVAEYLERSGDFETKPGKGGGLTRLR